MLNEIEDQDDAFYMQPSSDPNVDDVSESDFAEEEDDFVIVLAFAAGYQSLIEKIENTFIDDIQLSTEIEGNYCVVLGTNVYCEGEDKLDAIFKTVIKFIIYFNKINKI